MHQIEECDKLLEAYLTDISWERIYLNLKITFNRLLFEDDIKNVQFFLVNASDIIEAPFLLMKQEGQDNYLELNITNSGVNRCIRNGNYRIVGVVGDTTVTVKASLSVISKLPSVSRCFRYNGGKSAYTVNFMVEEVDTDPAFLLLVANMKRVGLSYIPPYSKSRVNLLKKISQRLYRSCFSYIRKILPSPRANLKKICRLIYFIVSTCRFNGRQNVLFLSERQSNIPPNMSALYDRMIERNLDKQFDIQFSLRPSTSEKQSIWSNLRCLIQISKANIIIVDDYVPWFNWLILNPSKTKLIQIWHAGAGFKGVGFSRWGHFGCPGPFNSHRQYAYCICDSTKISSFFSEQFGILNQQVIPTGMPRLDKFLNPEAQKQIRNNLYQKYPQLKGKKVILFAPTYRGRDRKDAHYPFEKLDLDVLHEYCKKNNSFFVFKVHPWVMNKIEIKDSYRSTFLDLSEYTEINDIFLITDLLITDYSSCMYEYALMHKPMLAFAYDLQEYSTCRGFHRSYEDNVPGKVCTTFGDLMDALKTQDYEFDKHDKYIENHFDKPDIHNSDRVIDWLILNKLPAEYANELDRYKNYISSVRGKTIEQLKNQMVSYENNKG